MDKATTCHTEIRKTMRKEMEVAMNAASGSFLLFFFHEIKDL
jgi:hypothetical protein